MCKKCQEDYKNTCEKSDFLPIIGSMMRQRQQGIFQHVEKMGIASLGELADMFGVSEFTIRRDIDYLARSRLLLKVKGGAQRIETPSHFREARLPNRMEINLAQKERIAERALAFIEPGDTLFLDGSSTIVCLARAMAGAVRDVTVLTNSILVSLELCEAADIRVIGLGGVFDRETFSYVGFDDDSAAAEPFHVEKAFFSCTGFSGDLGTFENAAFNRSTKRLMARYADKVFLLIDSSKFGRHALARVLDVDQIDTLIADKLDSADTQRQLQAVGIECVLCDGKAADAG